MRKNVFVFVYGDIGRSPRMQNHAYELSKYYNVSFMGFVETAPRNEILHNEHINLINLKIPHLQPLKSFSFYLYALVLIILQICQIMYMFVIRVRRIEFVLVQVIRYHMKNPPCIPNLFAIWLASLVCRFKIVVDFHNYGYTILALNVRNKFILKFAKLYEHIFVKKASIVFCVS